MSLDRRTWLQWASASVLATGAQQVAWAQEFVFDKDPFQLGVASGQPTAHSVVLWTRLLAANPMRNPWKNQALPVEWVLATDEAFHNVVQTGQSVAPPELSHSVHVDVSGLAPNTRYWYRFRCGSAQSPVGRTRTMPALDDAQTPLKVAFASCQRYHSGAFVAYDHMLADEPDLVVFLGDYIYEMGATQSENRGSWAYPANRIEDYRELYELAKSDPALQRMHAACPWLIIWDDHEVMNDYAGGPVRMEQATGKVARRMEMGYRTWYEHMPISPKQLLGGVAGLLDNSGELRVYGSHRWGALANLHLLDTRQYRSPQANCGTAGLFKPETCQGWQATDRGMLGSTQSAWLEGQLQANSANNPASSTWNLICQPSVFSRFTIPMMGNTLNHDNWDGYPVARSHILATLEKYRTRNPVMWGGDIHQNWITHVHQDPDKHSGPVIVPEFCVTSVTTASFGGFTAQEMKALSPHCVYADRHQRGYMLANLSQDKMTVTVKHVDVGTGAGGVSARFDVLAGSPQIRPVT